MLLETIPTLVEATKLTERLRVEIYNEGELSEIVEGEVGEYHVTDAETGQTIGFYTESELFDEYRHVEPEQECCDCESCQELDGCEECLAECCEDDCCEHEDGVIIIPPHVMEALQGLATKLHNRMLIDSPESR